MLLEESQYSFNRMESTLLALASQKEKKKLGGENAC